MKDKKIAAIQDKVLEGGTVDKQEMLYLIHLEGNALYELFSCANTVRHHYRSDLVDLCAIVSAKSGGCGEDCSFCAQSSISKAVFARYPLMALEEVAGAAQRAAGNGARRFCIVTAGRKILSQDMDSLCAMVTAIKEAGLLPCATLGFAGYSELTALKEAGLVRYHHNIETSQAYFSRICSSHTFQDKLDTLLAVKEAGLSLCSGGILGMGESWQDRIDMAFTIKEYEADSVPVNFLAPLDGTAMAGRKGLPPLEALKIISIYRLLLPDKEIRVCGGRLAVLGELHPFLFMAGADGLLIGDYLTTPGRQPHQDLTLITEAGLRYHKNIH